MTTVTPVETLESSETDQTLQRPPPGSRAHRALVVSADPAVRDGWARALEATGLEVHRCAGPGVNCILLGGGERCPLLDEADIALYHEPALTPAFLRRLGEQGQAGPASEDAKIFVVLVVTLVFLVVMASLPLWFSSLIRAIGGG